MPDLKILFGQLQKRQICSTFIQTCLQIFSNPSAMSKKKIPDIFPNNSSAVGEEPLAKRHGCANSDDEVFVIFKKYVIS